MKYHPILSLLAALIISSLIIGLIYLCFSLITFNLGGGETLTTIDAYNILYFIIAVGILIMAFYYAKKYIQKHQRSTAIGILTTPIILFCALSVFMIISFSNTKFDQKIWVQGFRKPEGMAKTLARKKLLVGLTRKEVKEMLGPGSEEHGDDKTDRGSIYYIVENGWTFIVTFKFDKVVEVIMRQPYLGI